MPAQDRPRRNFNPKKTRRYGRQTFNPDQLVKYSPKWQYSRLYNFPFPSSHWQPRMRSIVIAVDGGSRGNSRADPKSRAAYGVFFGPGCHRNAKGLLDPRAPQTSSRAELEGLRKALEIVDGMKRAGELDGWREVIIKLDSDYVARSLSEWIWAWERTNFVTRKGTPVEHADVIREMHATITRMEEEMTVLLWRVGREWNQEADALVNQALDDAADSGYED